MIASLGTRGDTRRATLAVPGVNRTTLYNPMRRYRLGIGGMN